MLLHLFFGEPLRFVGLRVPKRLIRRIEAENYSLVVAHDLELLPLMTQPKCGSGALKGSLKHVDLHELHELDAPSQGWSGLIWSLAGFRLRSYHGWLLGQLTSPNIDLVTVVNESIGTWYVNQHLIAEFVEIRNCAPFLPMSFEPRTDEGVRYLYHGKYAPNRGLEKLVYASRYMRDCDELSFMLTGNSDDLQSFQTFGTKYNPKLRFVPSVPMHEVSRTISQFDVEVIYFEPVTKNLLFTLPNKFFEAIQGRLAVISGPSPELVRHIGQSGNGISTISFDVNELSVALSSLNRKSVEDFRMNSHRAALILNSEGESKKLQSTWLRILGD
jgi:hypothetical protein